MGQNLCCFGWERSDTKVIPLSTLPNTSKSPNTSLLAGNVSFHRPVQVQLKLARSSLENPSTEISNRSSLATISLGSVQTLSSSKSETGVGERMPGDKQESSPSSKRHPGLVTPEPDEDLLHSSALSPGEAPQAGSSTLPHVIGGRQSRVQQMFRMGSLAPRAPTPRPNKATVIMVKPYQASSAEIPEETETERMCKHGIPLTGNYGDPHEVNCVRCERPASRGGRSLAGMIAFRRSQSKKRKANGLPNKQQLTAEQEKRKKTIEEYDDALRQFAEKHQNHD
ncbi:hypothetical protein ACROYT_G029185 [Oculina patagonica]